MPNVETENILDELVKYDHKAQVTVCISDPEILQIVVSEIKRQIQNGSIPLDFQKMGLAVELIAISIEENEINESMKVSQPIEIVETIEIVSESTPTIPTPKPSPFAFNKSGLPSYPSNLIIEINSSDDDKEDEKPVKEDAKILKSDSAGNLDIKNQLLIKEQEVCFL